MEASQATVRLLVGWILLHVTSIPRDIFLYQQRKKKEESEKKMKHEEWN